MSRPAAVLLMAGALLAAIFVAFLRGRGERGEPRRTAPESAPAVRDASLTSAAPSAEASREPREGPVVPVASQEEVDAEEARADDRETLFVLHGRVSDEDDRPLRGAEVTACLAGSREVSVLGDEDGTYRIELAPELARVLVGVVASAEGAVTRGQRLVLDEAALARLELECDLVLARACVFEVTVLDERREPVVGAFVRLADAGKSWGKLPPLSGDEWPRKARLQATWGSAVSVGETGADGRCRFTNASCGRRTVSVWHSDSVPRIEVDEEELERIGRDAVRVVLARGRALTGRVVDEGGLPVPGAEVAFRSTESGGVAVSDEEGGFRIGGLSYRATLYSLRCRAEGYAVRLDEAQPFPATGELELVLRRGQDLRLDLVDADTGRPIEGPARVDFDLGALRTVFLPEQVLPAVELPCRAGRLELSALPEFLAGIEVRIGDYDPGHVSFPSGIPTGVQRLVLARSFTCHLLCVDANTGKGLDRVQASLVVERVREGGGTRTTVTSLPMLETPHGNEAVILSSLVPTDSAFRIVITAGGHAPFELDGDRSRLAAGEILVVRLSALEEVPPR